jgi:hypothetical protein
MGRRYIPVSLHASNSDLACRTAVGSELVLLSVRRSEKRNKMVFSNGSFNLKIHNEWFHNLYSYNKGKIKGKVVLVL